MPYRREGVLAEVLDDRAMLVAPDGTELITLNPTGTAVWESLADVGEPTRWPPSCTQAAPRGPYS